MTYRKRPVEVEAFQMTPKHMVSNEDWPEWLHEAWNERPGDEGAFWNVGGYHIGTLEGHHLVSVNDWVIQGVERELYPCKPKIFKATYEEVT